MIMELATTIALLLLGMALLATIVRIVRGPTLADRILGLDTATILGIAVIGTFAARTRLYIYVDIAVALTLLGFVATVAFARYLMSRSQP